MINRIQKRKFWNWNINEYLEPYKEMCIGWGMISLSCFITTTPQWCGGILFLMINGAQYYINKNIKENINEDIKENINEDIKENINENIKEKIEYLELQEDIIIMKENIKNINKNLALMIEENKFLQEEQKINKEFLLNMHQKIERIELMNMLNQLKDFFRHMEMKDTKDGKIFTFKSSESLNIMVPLFRTYLHYVNLYETDLIFIGTKNKTYPLSSYLNLFFKNEIKIKGYYYNDINGTNDYVYETTYESIVYDLPNELN